MIDENWFVPPWIRHNLPDPDRWFHEERTADESNLWQLRSNSQKIEDSAILSPLAQEFGQIKSRKRVRDLAEVFTNTREVVEILNLVKPAFEFLDAKFLEPAAGNGNFLLEILVRKLFLVRKSECVSQEHYEHRLLRAIASIYGVDISADNVAEARARLAHMLLTHFQSDALDIQPTNGFLHAAAHILGYNIIQGDSLNGVHEIELCDWVPTSEGRFQRRWSLALVRPEYRDLFWEERVQDDEPVHFASLVAESNGHDISILKPGAAF
jgi:hypothetical protein